MSKTAINKSNHFCINKNAAKLVQNMVLQINIRGLQTDVSYLQFPEKDCLQCFNTFSKYTCFFRLMYLYQ